MKKTILSIIVFNSILTFCFAGAPDWDCDEDNVFDDLNNYENSFSVTSTIYTNGVQYTVSENDMLAAYVGNQLRGAASPVAAPFGVNEGLYQFLMLVYLWETNKMFINYFS